MSKLTNQKIREYAKKKNVCLWEIGRELGVNDGNFSRKLRKELSKEETKKIISIIDELSKKKGE